MDATDCVELLVRFFLVVLAGVAIYAAFVIIAAILAAVACVVIPGVIIMGLAWGFLSLFGS